MSLSVHEIEAEILILPEQEQQKVIDFALSLQKKITKKAILAINETALLSESALATDWNRQEEDEAWEKFQ